MATPNAIVSIDKKQFQVRNRELENLIASIVVKDAPSCLQMKTLQRDIRAELKARHHVLDPFVDQAKQNLDKAKDERALWIDPLEAMDEQAAVKVKDYERLEREKAEAEQRRINDERRRQAELEAAAQRKIDEAAAAEKRKAEQKAIEEARKAGEINKREAEKAKREAAERELRAREQAERDAKAAAAAVQDVVVKPAIPTVQGVPSRRNYRAEVTDTFRFIEEAARRLLKGDNSLSCFLMVNGSALGSEAREMKDSKAFMAKYPFTKAWED